ELVRVHDQEFELGAHRQVLLQDASLKDAETLVRISGQSQIHSRFKIFQLRPPVEDALQRNFQIGLEEKGHVWQRGKVINATHPFRRTSPDNVTGEGSEDIAIAEHDVAGAQQ